FGPLRLTQTRRVPSGDHETLVTPCSSVVSRRGSPPDSGRSQTWLRAASVESPKVRAERNASVLPSGLQRGLVDDCAACVIAIGCPEPLAGTVQMSPWRRFCRRSIVVTTYAIVAPSGEKCGSERNSNDR